MSEGRALTREEVDLTHRAMLAAFGTDAIDYDRVRVHRRKYVFCQGERFTVAPNGHIYCPFDPGDFASCTRDARKMQALLIHEMTHVLQFQQGVRVIARALPHQVLRFATFGAYDPYAFPADAPYEALNVEQQAEYVVGRTFPECVRHR